MRARGLRRLIVVTSMGAPRHATEGGVLQRIAMRGLRMTSARTLDDDMLKMERIVRGSGLDRTIVRPPGLSDDAGTG